MAKKKEREEEMKQESPVTETAEEEVSAENDSTGDSKTAEGASQETPDEEAAEDAAGEAVEASEEKNPKKSRSKKEKKDKKDEKIAELTDRLQRQMAEFDNFRKRTEKEKASMYQIGAKDVIEKILPVVDNFERGLATGDLSDPFVDGMDKIYKQMMTTLSDLGVTPIEAVGKPFDPELHNAVMHAEDENAGENEVIEELQKGYMYKDTVVRFSMVKVAN